MRHAMKKKLKKEVQSQISVNPDIKSYGDQIMSIIAEMGNEERIQTIDLINALLQNKDQVH
jgi:hypothetical protein